MKSIKKRFDREKLLPTSYLLFAFFPIIPNVLKGLPVILLLLAAIIFPVKGKPIWKRFFINSSLYLIFVLSLLYTSNFDYALQKLETGLSILVLPMVFHILAPQLTVKKSVRTLFFKLFIISTTIFSCIIITVILFDDSVAYYRDWYSNTFRTIITQTAIIGQHPIYASIFLSLSLVFYIELIKNKVLKTVSKHVYFIIFGLINLTLLIMILSKGVFLALNFVILYYIVRDRRLKRYRLWALFLVLIVFTTLFAFNRRMNELLKIETYTEVNQNFSTGIRVGIYQCCIEKIKENWLIGYGLGDSQDALNGCYSHKGGLLLRDEYNTHNQYLDITLKTGIIGLSLFVLFLVSNFIRAYRNKNTVANLILLFYAIVFLAENVLARQSGVILFYFLLLFLNSNKSDIIHLQRDSGKLNIDSENRFANFKKL
ncbi:MAG: O-antigen ligase family protein [Bacteroidota bacterium]